MRADGPLTRPRTLTFLGMVAVSMVVPAAVVMGIETLRPQAVEIDPAAFEQAWGGDQTQRGERLLHFGDDGSKRPTLSGTGPWFPQLPVTVDRDPGGPVTVSLVAKPGQERPLHRDVAHVGRSEIRKTLRRTPADPAGGLDLEAALERLRVLLSTESLGTLSIRALSPEDKPDAERWSWPPERASWAASGFVDDRGQGRDRIQIHGWRRLLSRADGTRALDPTFGDVGAMAQDLIPFPTYQRMGDAQRHEVAGDLGQALFLAGDQGILVGAITGGATAPLDAIRDLRWVTALGADALTSPLYDLYDGRPGLVLGGGALLYIILWTLWLLRASSWAAQRGPEAGASPLGGPALIERLRHLSASGPVVFCDGDASRLEVGWDLSDLRVQELMSPAVGARQHSPYLLLTFEPSRRVVRAQARVREVLWDGTDEGPLRAQEVSSRLAGVGVIDRSGPVWSQLETGDWEGPEALSLTELRALVSHRVVRAGWTLRPVLSFARLLSG